MIYTYEKIYDLWVEFMLRMWFLPYTIDYTAFESKTTCKT
jgi:hypothetical protein